MVHAMAGGFCSWHNFKHPAKRLAVKRVHCSDAVMGKGECVGEGSRSNQNARKVVGLVVTHVFGCYSTDAQVS